jgi:hypothetical protein
MGMRWIFDPRKKKKKGSTFTRLVKKGGLGRVNPRVTWVNLFFQRIFILCYLFIFRVGFLTLYFLVRNLTIMRIIWILTIIKIHIVPTKKNLN